MQLYGWKRYPFKGDLYIPIEDVNSQGGVVVMTFDHVIDIDFTDDPDAPRQLIICREPLPTTARVTNIRDRYGVVPMPNGEYTITSVEPVMTIFNTRDFFRHQAALSNPPDFGYEIQRN